MNARVFDAQWQRQREREREKKKIERERVMASWPTAPAMSFQSVLWSADQVLGGRVLAEHISERMVVTAGGAGA